MAKGETTEGFFNTRMIITIVLAIVIITSGVLGYKYLSRSQDPFQGPETLAETGDKVAINYTGSFEDGTVFDTSLLEVAEDDNIYPKALSFTEKSVYKPLIFIVGNGDVIKGFDDGVMGLGIGQTRTIIVPPEDGYGDADPNLIVKIDLEEKLPLFTTDVNITDFRDVYSLDPVVGTTVFEENWGWNAVVYFVNEDTGQITLKHEPKIGDVIDYNGAWESEVIGIDSSSNGGEITIRHLLKDSDANNIYHEGGEGAFIVVDVDTAAGTATLDYNREVVGKTLIFKITLEEIIETTSADTPG